MRLLYQILIFSLVLGFVPLKSSLANTPNVTFRVSNSAGSLLTDAIVKVYTDWQRTIFADDLSRTGSDDAQGNTASGEISFSLAPGNYEYIVEKISLNSIYGTLVVVSSSQTINLTMATAGATVVSPQRSLFSLNTTAVPADGVSVITIDTLVRNNDNTGLNGYSISMVSNRGSIDKFDANPKETTNAGRAQFLLSSSIPGKTRLYASVAGVRVSTNAEITFTGEAAPSAEKSTLSLSSTTSTPGTSVTLEARVRSLVNDPLEGRPVTVTSNRANDNISPASANTDAAGAANFTITPETAGTSTLTVKAGTVTLGTLTLTVAEAALPAPVLPLPLGVSASDLVKSAENSAVYYVGRDGKRHAFPNEKTYFTWYSDFSSVKTISAADLASLTLGKNVTYAPGARMIKLQTVPKVYAVGRGSVLRWVQTEALAIALYGNDWNKKIDDLSDAFFINYTEGTVIDEISDFSPAEETAGTVLIDDQLGL